MANEPLHHFLLGHPLNLQVSESFGKFLLYIFVFVSFLVLLLPSVLGFVWRRN